MKMLKRRIHVASRIGKRDKRSEARMLVELTPLTVVIGANGAGKSNLLSLFRLLNAMFANTAGFRNCSSARTAVPIGCAAVRHQGDICCRDGTCL